MMSMKFMLGLTLIGAWVWFMGCLAPCNTAMMLDRDPQKKISLAHEVAPGKAHLLLEQVIDEHGVRTYDLMLVDYLVGRPTGQGMRFSLTEKSDYVWMPSITESELQPVKRTATAIRILYVADRLAAEQALPPTVRNPEAVAVHAVLGERDVEVTFWYRDVAGQVREGRTSITPKFTAFIPWTHHARVANVLWTLPADAALASIWIAAAIPVALVLVVTK